MNNKIKKLSILIVTLLITITAMVKEGQITYGGTAVYLDEKENLSTKSGCVVDINDALTTQQLTELSQKAEKVAAKYSIKIVIYIDNMPGYFSNLEIDEIYSLTGKTNNSGLIFYFNTYGEKGERDYAFDVKGDLQKAISTTYGMDKLEDAVVDKLSDDKFYEAFDTLIDMTDDFCRAKEDGKPYSITHPYLKTSDIVLMIAGCIVISIVIGIIYIAILKGQMKTVHRKVAANEYVDKGGMNYTGRKDIFIYSHLSRVRRQTNNSSGGHGGRSGGSMRRGKC